MKIVGSYASHNEADAHLAYDGDAGTRWTTGVPMEPGMVFAVELEAPAMISGVHLTAPTPSDDPPSWVVAVMASSGGHGYVEVARGTGPVIATWTPVRGQWVKITCLGKSDEYWWSISQVEITAVPAEVGPEPPPVVPPVVPPEPPPGEDFGPATWEEVAARRWIAFWAEKFGWWYYEDEKKDFSGLVTRADMHIIYPIRRRKANGALEPWPFTE